MGLIACLTTTTAWADITIDEAHFPDEGFRQWLKEQPFGLDGVITNSEINSIAIMEIWPDDADYTIKSVKGIEYFTCLTNLSVTHTVDAIDVSVCPQLKRLTVSLWGYSNMTSIDLSKNTALEEFICVGSAITSLDLRNNPLLKRLFVNECAELATMDISNCKKLEELRCFMTQLSSIDVSNCIDLKELNCHSCPNLTSINVTNCGELIELNCSDTPVTSINVSTCKKLAVYRCERTNLTRLDLTPNGGITVLACSGGKLTEIILPNSLVLDINCQDNPQLTTLTIPGNEHLNTLDFSNTQVSTVDVTSSTKLNGLWCSNSALTSIDLTHCPDIRNLECTNTPLKTLDLSQCLDLENVQLSDNQLTTLTMPASCKLVTLKCQNNKLTSLDLTGCRQMEWLECQNNQLSSLLMPTPIVYPTDYEEHRYQLYNVDISVNQLKGTVIDAFIDKLPQKEWETSFYGYDSTVANEGNVFTQAQVAAAKAKNWIVTNVESNPSSIQLQRADKQNATWYSLDGIRQQGQPTQKGIYIKGSKKVLVK